MAGRAAAKVPIARVGQALSRVGTPALVLDLDAFEQNARSLVHQMKDFEKRGPNGKAVALRPHAKAHKCSALALRQMDLLGSAAVGLGCQTLAEAEILASAGEQRDSPVEKNPLLPPSSQVVSHTQEPDAEAIARAGARVVGGSIPVERISYRTCCGSIPCLSKGTTQPATDRCVGRKFLDCMGRLLHTVCFAHGALSPLCLHRH